MISFMNYLFFFISMMCKRLSAHL